MVKGSAWVSTLCRHPPHVRVVRNIRAFIYSAVERLMFLSSEICCALRSSGSSNKVSVMEQCVSTKERVTWRSRKK